MRPWPPAVAQNIRVKAASVFEGIRQDRQTVEGPALVDGLGEAGHVGRSPGGVDTYRVEGVAEEVTDQGAKGIAGVCLYGDLLGGGVGIVPAPPDCLQVGNTLGRSGPDEVLSDRGSGTPSRVGGARHGSPGSKARGSQVGVIAEIPVIHPSHGVVRRRTCFGTGGFGGSPRRSQLHQGGFALTQAFPNLDAPAT